MHALRFARPLSAALAISSLFACSDPDVEPLNTPDASDPAVPDVSSDTDLDVALMSDAADAATPDVDVAPSDCPSPSAEGISALLGDIAPGEPIIICGSGFGETGPTTVFFEDFEYGQPGQELETTATLGQWLNPAGTYVDDSSLSGSNALLVADHIETEGRGVSAVLGFPDDEGDFGLKHFDEFFVHWSMRDLGDFPGNNSSPTSFSSDSSAKDIWVMYGDRGDNYDYSCRQGTCNGNDIVLATHTGSGSFKVDGNNSNTSWWIGNYWAFERWNTLSTYLKIDAADPYGPATGVFEHTAPEQGVYRNEYQGTVLREEHTEVPPVWDRLKFGAWYRTAGDVRRIFDDIYVAVGPGAAARVEIANAPEFDDASRIVISPITSWSDKRIDLSLRLADLADSPDDLYLFVVDAQHRRSAGVLLNR